MPEFSALWITIPLGLLMLGYVCWDVIKTKAGQAGCDQPSQGVARSGLSKPQVIPFKYGKANQHESGGYEGLFLKNLGEPAIDVVAHPVELGARKVTFSGPEIPYLGTDDTRFLAVDVEGPLGNHSTTLFHPFRAWQQDIGDWTRETTGRLTYKDTHGGTYETTYELGVDILNTDGSMVVRFVRVKKS